jgi:hypothetical protein
VPAVVDTQKANADEGLVVISLQGQNQREDVADDHWLQVGKDLGMQHAMGEASYFGEWSPYFNLNHNSSTTYGFIIGRSGVVRWHGDLGSKRDEYFEELALALAVPEVPALPETLDEVLNDALAEWVEGNLGKAAKQAGKVRDKHAKRQKPAAQLIATQAAKLSADLEAYESQLIEAARGAIAEADAEAWVRSTRALSSLYPKSAYRKELKQLEKSLKSTPELASSVAAWHTWLDLGLQRPVTFPARKDKANKRFAKKVEKYLEREPDGPGSDVASTWLERWGE